jgi:hypothetical protein
MHEMLCSGSESWFDNRMLHVKKQLRYAESFFPLLYSKFLRDEFRVLHDADAPTAGFRTPGKVASKKHQPSDSNFSTLAVR